MKKILVRTGMTPFADTPIPEILAYNRIGINVGNIVYAYSVYRSLMTDSDVEFMPTKYLVSRLNPDELNEECERFIVPLADFIREDRVKEIKAMTRLINQLKIPCHIIGVGIRAEYDYERTGFELQDDKVAYNFFKAVLNKSPMIGLRGEITAEYMKKLGFVPEKDFTVIGCPSFFVNGEDLSIRDTKLTEASRLALNNNLTRTDPFLQAFLANIRKKIRNCYYFPQLLGELKMLYLGADYSYQYNLEDYEVNPYDEEYRSDRVRFHTHYLSWKKDLERCDFSFGSRLHGNVMALHAGLPSIWIVHDARMRELAAYHNLPHVRREEITEETDVLDLFARMDYRSVLRGHRERFRHYVDFLDKNGIPHIFKDYKNPKVAPLDKRMEELGFLDKDFSVKSFLECSIEELAKRIGSYDKIFITRHLEDLAVEEEIKRGLREERATLKKKVKDQTDILKKERAEKGKIKEKLEETRKELKEVSVRLDGALRDLSEEREELKSTKALLLKTKTDLDEAKKTLTFVVRRKVGKVIKKIKNRGIKGE